MKKMPFNFHVDLESFIPATAEDKEYWKRAYDEEELHSDALYSQNMSAYNEIEDLVTYLLEAKRMNKAKILDMLREIQNTLQNY